MIGNFVKHTSEKPSFTTKLNDGYARALCTSLTLVVEPHNQATSISPSSSSYVYPGSAGTRRSRRIGDALCLPTILPTINYNP